MELGGCSFETNGDGGTSTWRRVRKGGREKERKAAAADRQKEVVSLTSRHESVRWIHGFEKTTQECRWRRQKGFGVGGGGVTGTGDGSGRGKTFTSVKLG